MGKLKRRYLSHTLSSLEEWITPSFLRKASNVDRWAGVVAETYYPGVRPLESQPWSRLQDSDILSQTDRGHKNAVTWHTLRVLTV